MKISFFYIEMLIKVFPIYLKRSLIAGLRVNPSKYIEVEQLTIKT